MLVKDYTTYQIVVDLQTTNPEPKKNCSFHGGTSLNLAPDDGSETFCVCKFGYAGENCEEKVMRQSSSILESKELQKWSEKLHVPGMFDLMDAIEKSTEVISNHVTKVYLLAHGCIQRKDSNLTILYRRQKRLKMQCTTQEIRH